MIVGDVFSLDLALPLELARRPRARASAGPRLVLRRRPYTPAWSADYFTGNGRAATFAAT